MSGRRSAAGKMLFAFIALAVVSLVGFLVSIMLNAFVFDSFDAYGQVPIPGEGTVHLPAGTVNISLHAQVPGGSGGGGLPIPDIGFTFVPPQGVADPAVTEAVGGTTSVNNDVHRQVWTAVITSEGDYGVKADGKVSAFINPQLAFGRGSSYGYLTLVFVGVFGAALLGVGISAWLALRTRRTPAVARSGPEAQTWTAAPEPPMPTPSPAAQDAFVPTEEGIRLQSLQTLAQLRDSGALTEEEFQSEKRRLLDGR